MRTLITTIWFVLLGALTQAQSIYISPQGGNNVDIHIDDEVPAPFTTATYMFVVTHIESGQQWVYHDDNNDKKHPFQFFWEGPYHVAVRIKYYTSWGASYGEYWVHNNFYFQYY